MFNSPSFILKKAAQAITSIAWGSITGTLSSQTDLQSALDNKSDVGHNHDADYAALGHTHDDRYYTETEVNALLGAKADEVITVTGGTGLTGGGDLTANRTISLDSASIASLLLADSAVQPADLATVALTGDYDDLTNKPTIPNESDIYAFAAAHG